MLLVGSDDEKKGTGTVIIEQQKSIINNLKNSLLWANAEV